MATGGSLRRTIGMGYTSNAHRQSLLARSISRDLMGSQRYLTENSRLNQATTESLAGTISDVRSSLMKVMGIKLGYSPLQQSRSHLLHLLPATQEELPPRCMQDSFSSAIIPLSSDVILQEKYVNALGLVRVGRLMEDMDIFAVWVANKHLLNPKMKEGDISPYTLVTVLVDKIDFTDYIPKASGDIRLSGHVSWVGKSSIEVVVWLEQRDQNEWQKLTRALFLMAARDSVNRKAAFVNPLVPATDEEQKILESGVARKQRRQKFQTQSLLKIVPTAEEQQIIHDLFITTMNTKHNYLSRNRTLPPGSIWMEDASLSNLVFSHPEDRNYHNKVFGGFLMRHAFELSWASAYLFSKQRPRILHISDIFFHQPIDVNSLVRMHSNLVYTEHNCMQVAVYAEVFAPENNEITTTNEFHYTYQINDIVKPVLPRTYHEAMMYLNGRRNFQRVMRLA